MSGPMLGLKLAGIAAKFSGVGPALKKVPRWAWIAAAVAAAIAVGTIWHQHRAHAALAAARKAEDAVWAAKLARLDQQALALRVAAERVSQTITDNVRKRNDQANNAIAADAAVVRVRGPGAARCRPVDHPGVPAAADRARPGDRRPDAAGPQVPAGDWAAVPWLWLTNRAEQSDLDRAEVLAWRDWYQQQAAAWEKMRVAKP